MEISGQSPSGGAVRDSDEEEEDKTDAMTVNTDLLDDLGNEINQYQVVDDSSQESPVIPLRLITRPEEADELASDGEADENGNRQDDEDEIEVVSHVKRSAEPSEGQEAKQGTRAEVRGVRKGKGKAPATVHPDEPPENLLASFGKSPDKTSAILFAHSMLIDLEQNVLFASCHLSKQCLRHVAISVNLSAKS